MDYVEKCPIAVHTRAGLHRRRQHHRLPRHHRRGATATASTNAATITTTHQGEVRLLGIYALEYLNLTLEYRPKNGCAGVSTKLL
jgi:hypothetical protein